MHLRLVSPHPTPAVYLSLTFPYNAPHLPLPLAWTFSAQRLANDNLEVPNAVHFLDKSTWIISILDQVIFDLSSLTITCHFIDGTKEEWPLVAMDCVRALESVVADVNSALSTEPKRKDPPSTVPRSTTPPPPPPPTQPPTRSKHKKSRSFFAPFVTMVSGIVTTISLSSPIREFTFGPKIASASSPVTMPTPEESHIPVVRSECIRRRARGQFVDIYRSWILPELKRRSNFSDYYTWILRSLLERNRAHVFFLLEQVGAPAPPTEDDYLLSRMKKVLPPSRETSTGTEDEGDGLSIAATTDTDGSSIHTPTEGVSLYRNSYLNTEFPRSPSPQEFTPEDLELFHSLSQEGDRLRQLIHRNGLFESRITNDEAQLHSMLEVKSRRRAWSNRDFCGGAPMAFIGLATPFKSSPLARCEPITPEVVSSWAPGHNSRDSSHYLCVASGTHDLSELFPEVEEDYEEDDRTLVECQGPMVVDLEMGLPIPVTRAPTLQMKSRASAPKVTVRNPSDMDNDFLPFRHNPSEPLSSPPSLYPPRPTGKVLVGSTSQEFPLTMKYPPQYSEEDAIQPFRSSWNSSSPAIVMDCR
ncbi:hypothetical protein BDM02DRAFT_3182646 [Thelephora ganbajun]|uniref:Uncharacterized protein n=1 Tax=Thelephora ganbajun TaxID=370292 RepID=A0ACB6ZVX5_THEGA|nr:hypothetical protein BDM02DRAFT_3182646 [Thelephora ganbajun]